ncbi:unnamed protein product [Dovyalis caffra]|uniref:Late embryogenesis abundant protein LEA-2 subgroup domain-containing protein n=1 Tax=Dovyalis caffra TaxID=77055 RepID=A0AAV1SE23_9ROSI|nr:unnamed protein product [Dovyalis caffra]
MADKPMKPVLQRPPGYRDPNLPVKSAPRPPPTKAPLPLPPSFQPRKRRSRHWCRLCICCLILLIIISILLLVISGGLFYIWFNPKLPVLHLQSFKFSTFNVIKKSDGTYLTANMVARIEVSNPNEKIIYQFGESEVEITAGDDEVNLGSTSLPKFTLETKNTTSLKIETKVNNELIEDEIGSKILDQFTSKKLKVKMDVKTGVGIAFEGMKTGLLAVEVLCGGVTLKETESGLWWEEVMQDQRESFINQRGSMKFEHIRTQNHALEFEQLLGGGTTSIPGKKHYPTVWGVDSGNMLARVLLGAQVQSLTPFLISLPGQQDLPRVTESNA